MGLFDVIGTTCSGWLTDRLAPRRHRLQLGPLCLVAAGLSLRIARRERTRLLTPEPAFT